MKKTSGFTLIELMVTLFIVGILLTVGIPSLKGFMSKGHLVSASNDLLSAINIARSEAIKRNTKVTICDSKNGTSCAKAGSWEQGWIVFVDADGKLDGTGKICSAANTDCLLRVHDAIGDSALKIKGIDENSASIVSFTFSARGLPKDINGVSKSGIFSVCSKDANDSTVSRAIVLSVSGRARVSDNAAVITCP